MSKSFWEYIAMLFFYFGLAVLSVASGRTPTEALCIQILIVVVAILVRK